MTLWLPALRKTPVAPPPSPSLGRTHVVVQGTTGSGKSGLFELALRTTARNEQEGFTFLDKHGTSAQATFQWLSNPNNGCAHRTVRYFTLGAGTSFALNPFHPEEDSERGYHQTAMLWQSVLEDQTGEKPEEKPRIARHAYAQGFMAAQLKLTLVELNEFNSLAGGAIGEYCLARFHHPILRPAIEELHMLRTRAPREFLQQVEGLQNRSQRRLGSPAMRTTLGQRERIDFRRIMDSAELAIFDLSGAPQADADFLGKFIIGCSLNAGRGRPADAALHRLVADEASEMLCRSARELLDQARKWNVFGMFALQTRAQAREKGEEIFDSLITNTVKISFRCPEPDSAEYTARAFFTGHLNLQTYKPASVRPVAVGNRLVTLNSHCEARHQAQQVSHAASDSFASASMNAVSHGTSSAWSTMFSSGQDASLTSLPDAGLMTPATPIAQAARSARSHGFQRSGGRMAARTSARQSQRASAISSGYGAAAGVSSADTQTQAYVTEYAELPTLMYSLDELLHQAAGELMSLPHRHCIVKFDEHPPVRLKTADLEPAYRCAEFKARWFPLWLARITEANPDLRPTAEVDAEIAARMAELKNPLANEPEFGAPEPFSIIDDPLAFARGFLARRSGKGKDKERRDEPPGRAPLGDLTPQHERFRVIDGPKDDGDNDP